MNAEILTPADAAFIEYMIAHCYRMLVASKDHDAQLHWWGRMGHYINQRSPQTVRQMEIDKGLAT